MGRGRAAFPGRFQPFHRGHRLTVERYRREFDEVALAILSPERARTADHPLSIRERREIVEACYPEIDLVEVEEQRVGETEAAWARRLVDFCRADAVISRERQVREPVATHTDAVVIEQEFHDPDRYRGEEIRRRIREGESWRELVPDCCERTVAAYADVIAMSTSL